MFPEKEVKVMSALFLTALAFSTNLTQAQTLYGDVKYFDRTPTIEELSAALGVAESQSPLTRSWGQTRSVELRDQTVTEASQKSAPIATAAEQPRQADFKIEFDLDSAVVRPDARGTLDVLAEFLLRSPSVRVELGGHTDASGAAVYNQRLSQMRAIAVGNYITQMHGVPENQLSIVGYGEERPLLNLNPNDSRNRRVSVTRL